MPTITPTVTQVALNVVQIAYASMANGDDGAPIKAVNYADYVDRSVHVYGTFGAGGNLRVEGSNESGAPTSYTALNNAQSGAVDMTAAGVKQIVENVNAMRPRVTAGDNTTSLNVVFTLRRARSGQESA